jgi:hypothetical protein
MVRHGPLGHFMADNCRLHEPLLLLFEFPCQSYLPRTNEWMKVLSYKYQGNDNNNKNNRTLRVRRAFKYLLGFLLLSFPFWPKGSDDNVVLLSLKKKEHLKWNIYIQGMDLNCQREKCRSRDMSSAKSVSEMGKSVAHSQRRCECGQ